MCAIVLTARAFERSVNFCASADPRRRRSIAADRPALMFVFEKDTP